MKRNYRGRFEGPDWSMQADRSQPKRKGNFVMAAYNKFFVAIAGFILSAIASWTGIDFELLGLTPEALVTGITAILVWAVPNINEPVRY